MKGKRIVIIRTSMITLAVVALGLCNLAVAYAQKVEKYTEIGLTGKVDFAISFESDSVAEKAGIKGLIVESVEKGSRADKIGIKKGDLILSLNGRRMQSIQDVRNAFRSLLNSPDLVFNISYLRFDPTTRKFMFTKSGQMNKLIPNIATISSGILDEKTIEKPLPIYSAAAKAVSASGMVTVRVLVNEDGRIEFAEGVSGHPLLREAAIEAAYKARFIPIRQLDTPIKVFGTLTYAFTLL